MQKLREEKDVSQYQKLSKTHTRLYKEMLKSVGISKLIRENIALASACVILLDSEEEKNDALAEYRLSGAVPEISEDFISEDITWRRQVYILDDAGDGIILFYPLPPR